MLKLLNNFESYACRTLLTVFVIILFGQIVGREVFGTSFSWTEDLAVYMFVWFVFFGASYAAKLGAHNRVTFQFKRVNPRIVRYIEAFADLFWLFFNIYFVYLCLVYLFPGYFVPEKPYLAKIMATNRSQTLGILMFNVYLILPIAFTLMSVRIIQVNYIKLVKGKEIVDPDKVEVEKIIEEGRQA